MKRNQNGFAAIIVIILALAILGTVGYFVYKDYQPPTASPTTSPALEKGLINDKIDRNISINKDQGIPADLVKEIILKDQIDTNKYQFQLSDPIQNYDGAIVVSYRYVDIKDPQPTSGQYEIWYKEGGRWKFLVGGQDYPLCSTFEQIKIGKNFNCYDNNGKLEKASY